VAVFDDSYFVVNALNRLGLLSEHIDPASC
jgi:hypothetical protein